MEGWGGEVTEGKAVSVMCAGRTQRSLSYFCPEPKSGRLWALHGSAWDTNSSSISAATQRVQPPRREGGVNQTAARLGGALSHLKEKKQHADWLASSPKGNRIWLKLPAWLVLGVLVRFTLPLPQPRALGSTLLWRGLVSPPDDVQFPALQRGLRRRVKERTSL